MEHLLVALLLTTGLAFGQDKLRPILHQSLGFGTEGEYQYDYNSDVDTKQEVRDANGQIVGSFAYVDDRGMVQRAEYVAGRGGFQVSGTLLPKETPEVAAARAQHEAAVAYAKSVLPVLPPEPVKSLDPVEEQREVISADRQLELIAAEAERARAAYESALRAQLEADRREKEKRPSLPPPINDEDELGSFGEKAAREGVPVVRRRNGLRVEDYRISETMVSPIVQKRPQILAEQIPRNEFGETPEVARARIEHLRLLEEARRRNPPKVERDVMRVEYIPRKTRRQRTNDV